ncbi:unnamed protein product [Alopecurus aequalis]
MALRGISWWLLLPLLVAVTPVPCTCEEPARTDGSLIQCFDPATALTNATNGADFRASLLPLLGALPSAAALTGFAALRSDSDSDRAFVRGLCFADFTAPSECLLCLSAAAKNLTAGCGATARRAGIWTPGCFLAYADTDSSSPSEDAFRALLLPGTGNDTNTTFYNFYYENLHHMLVGIAQAVARRAAAEISGARMLATADATTVTSAASGNYSYYVQSKMRVVAQCARDGAAADCVRCLQDLARAVDWDLDAASGVVAAVAGFDCYLRFEVSTSVGPANDCE